MLYINYWYYLLQQEGYILPHVCLFASLLAISFLKNFTKFYQKCNNLSELTFCNLSVSGLNLLAMVVFSLNILLFYGPANGLH